jgi:hypothetical protein
MTAHKRTEITIETDRITIIRRQRSIRFWCPECGCEADMISLSEADALIGATGHTLNNGKHHVIKDQDGAGLVCLESLLSSMEKGPQKSELEQWFQHNERNYLR